MTQETINAPQPVKLKDHAKAIKARRENGESIGSIARSFGVNKGSIQYILKPPQKHTKLEQIAGLPNSQTDVNVPKEQTRKTAETSDAQETELQNDRKAARELMRKALKGKVELSAQQTSLIRLLLKDELEPEAEKNPYAGIETEELGLRALTCAVSVLGLQRVSMILSAQAKAGTLDLGLNWEPEEAKQQREQALLPPSQELTQSRVTVVMRQPASDGVETLETPKAGGIIAASSGNAPAAVVDSEVEAL